MIDPADRLLKDYVEGTDRTLPGEGSGEWGREPAGVTDVGRGSPNIYVQFYRILAANEKVVLNLDDMPRYWVVRVNNLTSAGVAAVGTAVKVYPYGDATAEPLQVDQGSKCNVVGRTNNLTLVANANGATVSVMAIRGHDLAGF